MKRYLISFILMFPLLAVSQEQLGLRLENYAGANSISLNPAGNLTNPFSWDLNLIGAGLHLENNYAFIPQTNTLDLLRNGSGREFVLAEDQVSSTPSDLYVLDFYDDGRKRYLISNAFVAGPSLVLNVHENHSVGFFMNFRTFFSALDFSNELSYYKYDARAEFDPFPVGPFSGAFMSWSEIGLNYAVRVPTRTGFMGFGINLKRLVGYEAGYLINHQAWTHTKLPDDHVTAQNTSGEYGLTTSYLDNNEFDAKGNGSGVGVDIGFLYVIQDYEDSYKWRFGASLLDLGAIKFSENTQTHQVQNNGTFELDLREFDDFDLPDEWDAFLQHFSNEALGDAQASLTGNSFTAGLPSAFSLQADYNINDQFFANALFMHHLPLWEIGPKRESLMAVTPRFEHPWLSVSMPVELVNWERVNVGLAARLGYLVIGSDNIGSWFGRGDYSGTDFYMALKLNRIGFGKGGVAGGSGKRKGKFGGRKKVKCYDF
ncbi:MAG: DUF5723 family protein [Bacteroidota bacterium]